MHHQEMEHAVHLCIAFHQLPAYTIYDLNFECNLLLCYAALPEKFFLYIIIMCSMHVHECLLYSWKL